MTQREEIVVKAGFDNTALASGLRQAEGMVSRFAGQVKNYLGGMFAVGALVSEFSKVLNKVEEIKNAAETTGQSVEGIQKLDYASQQLGISAETTNSALEKMNALMGEAREKGGAAAATFAQWGIEIKDKDNAEVLSEISDRMAEMTDPAERVAMAMDLFGRSGKEIVPLLDKGAADLKAMGDKAPLFSDDDMKNVETLKQTFENLGTWAEVAVAKLISGIAKIAQAVGTFTTNNGPGVVLKSGSDSGLVDSNPTITRGINRLIAAGKIARAAKAQTMISDEDRARAFEHLRQQDAGLVGEKKYNALLHERGELYAALDHDQGDYKHTQEDLAKLDQNAIDLATAKKEMDEETLRINKELADKKREQADIAKQMPYAQIHDRTPYMPTVEELAGTRVIDRLKRQYFNGGIFDMGRNSPFQGEAADLQTLQYQYAWNKLHPGVNSDAFVEDQGKRIDSMKDFFVKAGLLSPQDSLNELTKHSQSISDDIAALRARADKDGIPVSIPSD